MSDRTLRAVIKQKDIAWDSLLSLFFMHIMCLWAFKTGVSQVALIIAFATYLIRVFALTAGYHRYFSHRSYKTSRLFQFILALLGASAAQLGPIWWASHHRDHHRYSDTERDPHSPRVMGFFMSHMGWVMDEKNRHVGNNVADLRKFPELNFIDKHSKIPPILLAALIYAIGEHFAFHNPELGTNGFQMLIWAFFISTVAVYHVTFSINSITHMIGYKRFNTGDDSKNNFFTALLTMGEGWHNNHHFYQSSERQGFRWWEVDLSHYILRFFSLFGIVWDLREPPKKYLT